MYGNHCYVQQSLLCTAITVMYSNHCYVRQSLLCTAITVMYSNHCLQKSTRNCRVVLTCTRTQGYVYSGHFRSTFSNSCSETAARQKFVNYSYRCGCVAHRRNRTRCWDDFPKVDRYSNTSAVHFTDFKNTFG